jgi:hypothetical protein
MLADLLKIYEASHRERIDEFMTRVYDDKTVQN